MEREARITPYRDEPDSDFDEHNEWSDRPKEALSTPSPSDEDEHDLDEAKRGKPRHGLEVDEAGADDDTTFLHSSKQQRDAAFLRDRRKQPVIIISTVAACLVVAAVAFLAYQKFSAVATVRVGAPPALILASHAAQDVSWVSEISKSWKIYRYCNDCNEDTDPSTSLPNYRSSSRYGREANAYLTFIIDNYNNLPPFMVFLHGHKKAWHQPELITDLIRSLNLSAVAQAEYVALKCTVDTWCNPEASIDLSRGPGPLNPAGTGVTNIYKMMPAFWQFLFEDEPLPTAFKDTAGAQFVVTAEAVRRHPLQFYERIREPLENNQNLTRFDEFMRTSSIAQWGGESAAFNFDNVFGIENFNVVDEYTTGVLFEKFWHKIFGKSNVFCPERRWCNEVFFNNAFDCPGYNEGKEYFDHVVTQCTVDEDRVAEVHNDNIRVGLLPPEIPDSDTPPVRRAPILVAGEHKMPDPCGSVFV